jgi:hypothetical protein
MPTRPGGEGRCRRIAVAAAMAQSATNALPASASTAHANAKGNPMRLVPSCLLTLLLASSIADPCLAQAAPVGPGSGAQYIEVGEYLTRDADIETWYTALDQLKRNFDDVCGDTFCEGDYSNIQSLRLRCSVERHTGVLGHCVWIFAASNEEIGPADGRVLVDEHHWRCRIPLARLTRVEDLLAAWSGPQPLRATLPGTRVSTYDGLTGCL